MTNDFTASELDLLAELIGHLPRSPDPEVTAQREMNQRAVWLYFLREGALGHGLGGAR